MDACRSLGVVDNILSSCCRMWILTTYKQQHSHVHYYDAMTHLIAPSVHMHFESYCTLSVTHSFIHHPLARMCSKDTVIGMSVCLFVCVHLTSALSAIMTSRLKKAQD